MKKFIIAVLLALVASLVYAEEIKIVNGEVMLEPSSLVATGVKVTPEAAKYPDAVAEVFRDKTKEIALLTYVENRVVDLFHYESQTVQTVGVKYYSVGNTIGDTKERKVLGEPRAYLFQFPNLWLMAVLSMVVWSVLAWKIKEKFTRNVARAFTGLLSFFATILATGSGVSVVALDISLLGCVVGAACVAMISLFVAGAHFSRREVSLSVNRVCISAVSVYFIAMTVLAGVVYYPLFF